MHICIHYVCNIEVYSLTINVSSTVICIHTATDHTELVSNTVCPLPYLQVGKQFDALLIDTWAPDPSNPVFYTFQQDTMAVSLLTDSLPHV